MRYRTRTQDVDAVQWTGDNLDEVQVLVAVEGYVATYMHSARVLHITDGTVLKHALNKDKWLVRDENGFRTESDEAFRRWFEPAPDLIRTLEDYNALPDGTILRAVEINGVRVELSSALHPMHYVTCVLRPWWDIEDQAKFYVDHSVVCRVVELGGETNE